MSRGYSDLQDLIQNQRALAELVNDIRAHYDEFQSDIEYAREVDGRIQQLNKEMTDVLSDFDIRISESDARMSAALKEVQDNAKDLKERTDRWVEALQLDADGNPVQLSKLVEDIVYLTNLVFKGTEQPDGTWTGGLKDLDNRISALERKSPPLVIYNDGTDIPVEDRVEGVLYGRLTNEVTDIESGQVIKISPYLQGVVVDV